MLGPKRFTDLRRGLPNASPNILSERLRELEQGGVVHRRKLPPPAASQVYELTEWGRELEPGRGGERPVLTIETDPATLAGLLTGQLPLEDGLASGSASRQDDPAGSRERQPA